MKRSCPNCGSLNIRAGAEIVDQRVGIVRLFAGCDDCKTGAQTITQLKK